MPGPASPELLRRSSTLGIDLGDSGHTSSLGHHADRDGLGYKPGGIVKIKLLLLKKSPKKGGCSINIHFEIVFSVLMIPKDSYT